MKSLMSLILFSLSFSSFGNPLLGNWFNCEVSPKGEGFEQYIQFKKNNVKFEAFGITKPHKRPCEGAYELAIGIYSHYDTNVKVIQNTSFSSHLIVYDRSILPIFNSHKTCGKKKWKLKEKVECTNDAYLKSELGRGLKTKQEYSVVGDELYIVENGKTTIFKRIGK